MVRTDRDEPQTNTSQQKRSTGTMFYLCYLAGVALGYIVYVFQS